MTIKLNITIKTEVEVEEDSYPEDYSLENIIEEEEGQFGSDASMIADLLEINDYTVTVEEA
jgi:hypothetical protein